MSCFVFAIIPISSPSVKNLPTSFMTLDGDAMPSTFFTAFGSLPARLDTLSTTLSNFAFMPFHSPAIKSEPTDQSDPSPDFIFPGRLAASDRTLEPSDPAHDLIPSQSLLRSRTPVLNS